MTPPPGSERTVGAESAQGSRATAAGPLRRLLVKGAATLGLAEGFERALGYLTNIMAARIAGPEVMGTFFLALSTARAVATYSGPSFGATGTRFGGMYPRTVPEYPAFLGIVVRIAAASALLATALLVFTAEPIARILINRPDLAQMLQLGAIAAVAAIAIEVARGICVGQHAFRGALLLSVVSGIALAISLPVAAAEGAGFMIVAQGLSGLIAVGALVAFSGWARLRPDAGGSTPSPDRPSATRILRFGYTQLGSVLGITLASWMVAILIAQSDTSMADAGYYSVAHQFRGIVAFLPGILAQVLYPVLGRADAHDGAARDALVFGTLVNSIVSVAFGGVLASCLGWVIWILYGAQYAGAAVPGALLVCAAIVQMSCAHIANRLTVVWLSAFAAINAAWSVLLVLLAYLLTPSLGAKGAALGWLVCTVFSQAAAAWLLRKKAELPPRVIGNVAVPLGLSAVLASLALCADAGIWRAEVTIILSFSMTLMAGALLGRSLFRRSR
jgi:O-antigen/teichoic acid export membrane protein